MGIIKNQRHTKRKMDHEHQSNTAVNKFTINDTLFYLDGMTIKTAIIVGIVIKITPHTSTVVYEFYKADNICTKLESYLFSSKQELVDQLLLG